MHEPNEPGLCEREAYFNFHGVFIETLQLVQGRPLVLETLEVHLRPRPFRLAVLDLSLFSVLELPLQSAIIDIA
jgi:hypothetical protein